MNVRQSAENLKEQIDDIYRKFPPTMAQMEKIQSLRVEYSVKSAALLVEYMQKELDILNDLTLRLKI